VRAERFDFFAVKKRLFGNARRGAFAGAS